MLGDLGEDSKRQDSALNYIPSGREGNSVTGYSTHPYPEGGRNEMTQPLSSQKADMRPYLWFGQSYSSLHWDMIIKGSCF